VSEETFRWVVAGGVVFAAVFIAVIGVASLVVLMHVKKLMDRLEPAFKAAGPLAQQAQELAALLKPRILKISADVTKVTEDVKKISGDVTRIAADATQVSALVVVEAKRYAEISKDVSERAKVKIARFDTAVDDTVEQVHEATGAMKTAAMRPLHHLEGVVAGVRTAIHTYANGVSGRNHMYGASQYRAAQDEEMFI